VSAVESEQFPVEGSPVTSLVAVMRERFAIEEEEGCGVDVGVCMFDIVRVFDSEGFDDGNGESFFYEGASFWFFVSVKLDDIERHGFECIV
jgi:hypothetical protein